MSISSNPLSSCTHPKISLSSLETIDQTVQAIHTLLEKEVLCQHDITDLNQAYQKLDQLESSCDLTSQKNAEMLLHKTMQKVEDIHQESSPQQMITAYHLHHFKAPLLKKEFTPYSHSPNLTAEKIKEIAYHLPFCGKPSDLDADVKALLGSTLAADVAAIVQSKRNQIQGREEAQKRLPFLQKLRSKDPSLYPSYLEEILENGCFHLYDHLIKMKQLTTQAERELEEKDLSFSTFSHIILEFKKMALAKVEKFIQGETQTLFILGDTGSGKSTTLCYLKGNAMTLQDKSYQSLTLEGDLIGNDGKASCTLFPNIAVSQELNLVDFPGFNDTNGKVISFAIELSLRSLAKKYSPKILILSSITDSEGRFNHAVRLGERLKRVLGTVDHCILGLTKYSKDPDFINIHYIEQQQIKNSSYPSREESELAGSIATLLSLVEEMPQLQSKIDQKNEELLKLQTERLSLVAKELPDTEEKLKSRKNLKEREELFQESMGIKQLVRFADLTNPTQLEDLLNELKLQQVIPSLSRYHHLDPTDAELLEILVKNKLIHLIDSREDKKLSSSTPGILSKSSLLETINLFEKSILETSLINTLLCKSHPEIGKFFHLEEMDPVIVRKYDKNVIEGCIKDYIDEVIADLIIHQEVIEKFKNQFSKEQNKAIDSALSQLKRYILTLSLGIPEHANEDKVNQAWEVIRKEHNHKLDNRKKDLKISGFTTVTLLVALGIPYGIFAIFRKIKLDQVQKSLIQETADQLCGEIKAGVKAIQSLKEIERIVKDQDRFDEVFTKNPLSLESVPELKESLTWQIEQVKTLYGKTEWETRVAILIENIQEEFSIGQEGILYALMSQETLYEELPPYFNEHTFLALLHAFGTSQGNYQDSLKKLIPGWKPAHPQKLALSNHNEFFYAPQIKKQQYEELKTKGRTLFEEYHKTPLTRLLLIDAIKGLREESISAKRDETRSFVNFYLKNDQEKILEAVQDNEWILEYSREWVRNNNEFILKAIRCNPMGLRFATSSLRNDREVILAAVKQDGSAFKFVNEELKKDRDFTLTAINTNAWVLQFVSDELKKDHQVALAAVKQDGLVLQFVSEELKDNREVVLSAIKQNERALQFVDNKLKKDRDFVLSAVKQNGRALQFVDNKLKKDRHFILAAIKQDGRALQFVSEELKDDRDFVLAAVKHNGSALQFVSEELKDNRDFVLAAVKQDGLALQFVSEELKDNHEVILAAVKHNGLALQFVSEELKDNREIDLAAVKHNGLALQFVSEKLKKDREVVLAAVKHNGLALQFVSEELKDNREVAMTAVNTSGWALQFVSEKLKKDREVVLAAVNINGLALQFVSEKLKKDREVVLAAVNINGWALQFVSEKLKKDREVVLAAIKQDGSALQFVSEEFKKDRKVVLAAVNTSGWALQFVDEELKKDRHFILAAIKQDGLALQFVSEELKKDRDFVLSAAKKDRRALQFVGEELKKDRDFILAAVKQDGLALQFVSEELKKDRMIAITAIKQNGWAFEFVSEELKKDREVAMTAIK
ncbi:MAG: DUF4116 domain-containing protein [Candidatus Rhabdochlamydia sp.]